LTYLTKDSNQIRDIRPRDSISRCSTHKANNLSVQGEVREDRDSKLRNENRPFSWCKMLLPKTRFMMEVLSQSLCRQWCVYVKEAVGVSGKGTHARAGYRVVVLW